MQKNVRIETTAFSLHLMAMVFMLCDHLWATLIPGQDWMTCLGRIAFPIFAFMIVEGYFHTRSLKKYVLRLFLFALLSEIPFNLMMGSSVVYPYHQNVLWTFLLGIGGIWLIERSRKSGKLWLMLLTAAFTVALGALLGLLTMVDYFSVGVLTVLVFYMTRGKKWYHMLLQFLLLYWLNVELMGGRGYMIFIFGHGFFLEQQSFALLALIPIWLYRGKQGPHNRPLQYCFYAFYPVHMLVLALIQMYR